jgi:hypothetical protein
MLVYLIKMERNGKIGYKAGVSKWGERNLIAKRFSDQYEDNRFFHNLDNLSIVDCVQFSRDTWKQAIVEAEHVEKIFLDKWKKSPSFCVETYFGWQRDELGYIGGVTEMIFLDEDQTEEQLVDGFKFTTRSLRGQT